MLYEVITKSFYKNLEDLKSDEDFNFLRDMLNISFPNGYCFWYIGKSQDTKA